jgi:hypothetical protein
MGKIFADSNYFIALYNPGDSLHREAIRVTNSLKKENQKLVISNFVFLELVTVLSQRVGRVGAIYAGVEISGNSSIEFIHVDEMLQNVSWQIFQDVKEKSVSFVDCSIIAVMRAEGIHRLLTFDVKDFKNLQKQYRISLYPLGT